MGRHDNQGRLRAVYTEFCQPFYKRYRKFIIAAVNAALIALFAVISNGVTSEEWIYIALSAGAALGVCRVPNAPNKKVIKNDAEVQ